MTDLVWVARHFSGELSVSRGSHPVLVPTFVADPSGRLLFRYGPTPPPGPPAIRELRFQDRKNQCCVKLRSPPAFVRSALKSIGEDQTCPGRMTLVAVGCCSHGVPECRSAKNAEEWPFRVAQADCQELSSHCDRWETACRPTARARTRRSHKTPRHLVSATKRRMRTAASAKHCSEVAVD